MNRTKNMIRTYISLTLLALASLFSLPALATYDPNAYDFSGSANFSKGGEKSLFLHGDGLSLSKEAIDIWGRNSCTLVIDSVVNYEKDSFFEDEISSHGGEKKFNDVLKSHFGLDTSKFKKRILIRTQYPDSKFCFSAGISLVFQTDSDIILINENEAYKFSKEKPTQKDLEQMSGQYKIGTLPLTNFDIDCVEKACEKNKPPVYDGVPKHFEGKQYPGDIEEFRQLPSIGAVEVYLSTLLEESGERKIYLLTYNGEKVNYVRLGDNFTIGKDYSVIKTTKSGKQVNYAIKPNGIIIKTE